MVLSLQTTTMSRTTRSAAKLDAQEGNKTSEIRSSEVATSQKPSNGADFKSSLQRFQYDSASSTPIKDVPAYKITRKRPLEDTVGSLPTPSASPSPAKTTTGSPAKKKRRASSKYAPPSTYAHLPKLLDILEPGLVCVFVGTNPGIRTATAGHAYAHPSNLFWKLLHSSGCTDRRHPPEDDVRMSELYSMGNTNIIERPSRDAAELSKAEMAAGTPILEEKIRRYRPEAVCIVGKGIWEAIWRWRYGREIKKAEFKYGWQDERERMGKVMAGDGNEWVGAPVFVASSTSGLSASLRPAEKEAIWKPFGEWVRQRRKVRAEAVKDDRIGH